MQLDPSIRTQFSERILNALHLAFPQSELGPAGSLASSTTDQYSDINLRWVLPDEQFQDALKQLPALLTNVAAVIALRSDPRYQNSDRRRVLFIRFAGLPLFWRVELEIFAASVADNPNYDNFNAAARGTDWSLPESALWSAVAAIKSILRGNEKEAHNLLRRAYQHIDVQVLPKLENRELVEQLLQDVAKKDSKQAEFAAEIRALAKEALK